MSKSSVNYKPFGICAIFSSGSSKKIGETMEKKEQIYDPIWKPQQHSQSHAETKNVKHFGRMKKNAFQFRCRWRSFSSVGNIYINWKFCNQQMKNCMENEHRTLKHLKMTFFDDASSKICFWIADHLMFGCI